MLAEIAEYVVLRQVVSSEDLCLMCPKCIDGLLITFFERAITRSLVIAGIGEIDESDMALIDTLLQIPPRFET
jgi:hypothetical protein